MSTAFSVKRCLELIVPLLVKCSINLQSPFPTSESLNPYIMTKTQIKDIATKDRLAIKLNLCFFIEKNGAINIIPAKPKQLNPKVDLESRSREKAEKIIAMTVQMILGFMIVKERHTITPNIRNRP